MPSYQNKQTGIVALMLLLVWSEPALAQRVDTDQPISLIENAPTDASVVLKEDVPNQEAEISTAVDQSELIEADLDPKISPVDNSLAETSSAYAQVTLGRRKISEVGLAAIGVGDSDAPVAAYAQLLAMAREHALVAESARQLQHNLRGGYCRE